MKRDDGSVGRGYVVDGSFGFVHCHTIPDNKELTLHMVAKMLKERNQKWRARRTITKPKVETSAGYTCHD